MPKKQVRSRAIHSASYIHRAFQTQWSPIFIVGAGLCARPCLGEMMPILKIHKSCESWFRQKEDQ